MPDMMSSHRLDCLLTGSGLFTLSSAKKRKKCFTQRKNERTMTSMVGVEGAIGAPSPGPSLENLNERIQFLF